MPVADLVSALTALSTRTGDVAKVHKDSIDTVVSVLASVITRLESVEALRTTLLAAYANFNTATSRMTELESWAVEQGYTIASSSDSGSENNSGSEENNSGENGENS